MKQLRCLGASLDWSREVRILGFRNMFEFIPDATNLNACTPFMAVLLGPLGSPNSVLQWMRKDPRLL